MKKIVIVTKKMIMGGVERALISMLESIPKDKFDVTILVMGMGGELEDEIPVHVKVEPVYSIEKSVKGKVFTSIKRGKLLQGIKIIWYTILPRYIRDELKKELLYAKREPARGIEYDLAIAYHVPTSLPVAFVMNKIKAKSKVAWIHTDVSQVTGKLAPFIKYYKKYDKIFCVSENARRQFIEINPNLKEKTSVFYNILDKNRLEFMAGQDEGFTDQFNGIRILTVGRLSPEKGQDIIPAILFRLKSKGFKIRWYCIGDGEGVILQKLDNMIKKYGLEEDLVLLGTKRNPYKFISQSNIYVQTSRHEGYCISLAEARVFNKPIVTTDFVGAKEQIVSGENGLIVKFDESEIYLAIEMLINNKNLCERFVNNLKCDNMNTTNEINKLFDCFV